MKEFKFLFLTSLLLLFFNGCSSSENSSTYTSENCPTCNMKIPSSKLYTSSLHVKERIHHFDDIGCMILFCKDNQIDLNYMKSEVFSTDTKIYINSLKAYYKIDENTPMGYGFAAYENEQKGSIKLDEVIVKMLRGEHMANPKIRKQILGSEHAQ